MTIGVTNSNTRKIELKDRDGNVVGTISYTVGSSKKKTKKLQYNMRQMSAKILRSKTSGSARMALTGAKSKVAQLRQQLKKDEYDSDEVKNALAHAMQIERVAKKKLKHLQEEEAAKTGGVCRCKETDGEMTPEEELSEEMLEELEKLLEETAKSEGVEELSEELAAVSGDMDPDDLEEMKRKHRSEEQKDILEADMKYLKAMFYKLQKEKQENAAKAAGGSGVTLQLGGAEVPVETYSDASVMSEGLEVDYQA